MDFKYVIDKLEQIYQESTREFANGWFSGFYFAAKDSGLFSVEWLDQFVARNNELLEEHKWDDSDD